MLLLWPRPFNQVHSIRFSFYIQQPNNQITSHSYTLKKDAMGLFEKQCKPTVTENSKKKNCYKCVFKK